MSDTKKPQKEPISFQSIDGKFVGMLPESVKGSKEIDFTPCGGQCVRRSPLWVESEHEASARRK
jgi:hypothetical protein